MSRPVNRNLFLFASLLAATAVIAHPHYTKEIKFSWERSRQGGQDVSTTIQHITVPYNEMKVGDLEIGKTWHLGFANMQTAVVLKNGDSELQKGEYAINVRRGKDDTWTLLFVTGKDENKKEIELAGDLEKDRPSQEHLRIDLHPAGDKASASVFLEVSFGTYRILSELKRS